MKFGIKIQNFLTSTLYGIINLSLLKDLTPYLPNKKNKYKNYWKIKR